MQILDSLEKSAFAFSLRHPSFFRYIVRPELYRRCDNEPEKVHEESFRLLNKYSDVVDSYSKSFVPPKELYVEIKGRKILPFGTAAGLDKNGDIIHPVSKFFGFQENGTVIVPKREGNKRPRVVSDPKRMDLYNAQGFPSEGLLHYVENVKRYRENGGDGVIYVNICGLPLSEKDAIETSMQELEILLKQLELYVDGFVWNPFSPNTEALIMLRTPKVFRDASELIRRHASDKLSLVKIGPYEQEKTRESRDLVSAFIEGGGDGAVAVNTYSVPKEAVPSKEWGYKSAGRSGRFLKPYRMRAISDLRNSFPDAVIFATGGIYDEEDAFECFYKGADAIEGFTPYTFFGFGLTRQLMMGVADLLQSNGFDDLENLRHFAKSKRFTI